MMIALTLLCREADLVMMNSVLHHIPEEVFVTTCATSTTLRSRLFSLDGCYRPVHPEGASGLSRRIPVSRFSIARFVAHELATIVVQHPPIREN